jgi:hypothetical protein
LTTQILNSKKLLDFSDKEILEVAKEVQTGRPVFFYEGLVNLKHQSFG